MNCSKSLEYEEQGFHLKFVEYVQLVEDHHVVIQVDV